MFLYFVRHGESVDNAAGIHQGPYPKLSPLGQRQANYVVKRLQLFPIEAIFSSHFTRAQQTAEIINETLQKKIIFTELLREIMQPSELHGRHYTDPEMFGIKQQIEDNKNDVNWHYSDEENFTDFTKRAHDFLAFVEKQPYKHLAVVSHGNFIRLLVGLMTFDTDLSPLLYYKIRSSFFVSNTGITIVEKTIDNKWQLKTWNDYAHLKELEE